MTKKRKTKQTKAKLSAKDRFLLLIKTLCSMAIEKEGEILCLAVALLARENVLILGKPGAAKTMIAKLFCQAILGATWFYYLLSKTTEPNEIFGPVNPLKFKQGEFVRITKGMAPEAHLVYLDECFKSNSSILNSLLTLTNEHQFQNGTAGMVDCPTELVIGCSNELPEDEKALAAFYDRFPIRKWSGYIQSDDAFKKFLMSERASSSRITKEGCTVSLQELHTLQDEVDEVDIFEPVIDVLISIKKALLNDPNLRLEVSDRKWEKIMSILQAHAFIHGRDEVTEDDLLFLPNCLWNKPEQLPRISKLVGEIANPIAALCQESLDACKEAVRELPMDRAVEDSQSASILVEIKQVLTQLRKAESKINSMTNGKPNHTAQATCQEIGEMRDQVTAFMTEVVSS
jgi:MoxR-like ATPase